MAQMSVNSLNIYINSIVNANWQNYLTPYATQCVPADALDIDVNRITRKFLNCDRYLFGDIDHSHVKCAGRRRWSVLRLHYNWNRLLCERVHYLNDQANGDDGQNSVRIFCVHVCGGIYGLQLNERLCVADFVANIFVAGKTMRDMQPFVQL